MKDYIKKIIKNIKQYNLKTLLIKAVILSTFVCYLDIINLPTQIINNGYLYILLLLIVLLILVFFDLNLIRQKIGELNKNIIICLISNSLLIVYTIFFDYKLYKIITIFIFYLVLIILKIINNYQMKKIIIKPNESNDSNVIDLKKLCEGNFEIKDNGYFFIEESEVDYDLLSRDNIINQLYNSIINCKPHESFTIGLNGKWGTGKTTIVNNVLRIIKENELIQNYVIVKFDPWKYDDEKSILRGLLLKISDELGITKDYKNINYMINCIIDAIFDKDFSIFGDILKKINNLLHANQNLDLIIRTKLQNNNKTMLVIIDNLDRIDNDKALFLIKSIKTITNYNNTIYILLYDETIIDAFLNKMYITDNKYMEKIVQLKIDVNEIDIDIINDLKEKICSSLIKRKYLLPSFKVEFQFKTLRELKRFFNSILSSRIDTNKNYNYSDYISLEYIKNNNIDLYYEIWNNKYYFIIDDRQFEQKLYTVNRKKLNEESKTYFNSLFSNKKHQEYKTILCNMFPIVKNYFEENAPFEEYRNQEEYKKGITDNRIYNARYFDLYFTKNENIFIRINKIINKIIEMINSNETTIQLEREIYDIVKIFDEHELKVFMETLELNIDIIKESKLINAVNCLYGLHSLTYDRPIFWGLDSFSRCGIIIADILLKLSDDDYNVFLDKIKNDYQNIKFIDTIKYWLDSKLKQNKKRIESFNEIYNELCRKIYDNKINLFDKEHYKKGNIWSLYHYDNDLIKQYIFDNVNSDNVYRFLNDLISNSVGTNGYGYYIVKANINVLCPNLDIEKLITEHGETITKDEQFIKEIYNNYKENTDKDNEIYKDEYIHIKDFN